MSSSSAKYAKLEQEYQKLVSEVGVLRCRLESKSEALVILTRDLEQCQSERDQFKLMADQLRERHGELRRRLQAWGPTVASVYDARNLKGQAEKSLAQLLCDLKEQNRRLQSDNQALTDKLREALEDSKLLREQLQERRRSLASEPCTQCSSRQERQEMVRQLETLQARCSMLEGDLQAVLDEKEELVRAGDAYRHKVERLNLQLNHALRGGADYVPLDVDALLMENRYMQERLQLAQEEKTLLTSSLNKYKSLAEKNRGRASSAAVLAGVSSKQIQQLLRESSLDLSSAGNDMRGLVSLLLEALSDRTLALAHQRKANKVLGNRVTELETRLKCDSTLRVNMPLSSTDMSKPLGGSRSGSSSEDPGLLTNGALELSTSKAAPEKEVRHAVISRESSRDEEECLVGEEDLPPELQRLLSAAMKELSSPQHHPHQRGAAVAAAQRRESAATVVSPVADLAC
ncbi:coiled-coil domain-containing protein 149-like isoform X2 [Haemaphysalis longicornis]